MRATSWSGATLAVLALVAAGCDSTGTDTSSTTTSLTAASDVTQLASAGVAGVADGSASVMGLPCGGPPPGGVPFPPGIPSGCEWDAASGSFVCAPFTDLHGFTLTRSYAFLDANGVGQALYDDATTASIRFEHSASGTDTRDGVTHTITSSRTLTESGMAGAETSRAWNGTGTATMHDEGTFRDGSQGTIDVTIAETVSDVVVPEPRTPTSWPLSGSITRHVTRVSTVSVVPSEDVSSVLSFNGTQYATLTMGDQTISIDLARPPLHSGPPRPGMRPPG